MRDEDVAAKTRQAAEERADMDVLARHSGEMASRMIELDWSVNPLGPRSNRFAEQNGSPGGLRVSQLVF